MTKNYRIAIVLIAIIFLTVLLYCIRNHQGVDDENIREMDYYLKQKECTQIMIDQSNGHNVKLPEDCPQY